MQNVNTIGVRAKPLFFGQKAAVIRYQSLVRSWCFRKSNSSTFKDLQTQIQGLSRTRKSPVVAGITTVSQCPLIFSLFEFSHPHAEHPHRTIQTYSCSYVTVGCTLSTSIPMCFEAEVFTGEMPFLLPN